MSKTNLEENQKPINSSILADEFNNLSRENKKLKTELENIKDKYDYSVIFEHLNNADCKLRDRKMEEFIELFNLELEIESPNIGKVTRIETDITCIKDKIKKFGKIKYELYINRINNKQVSIIIIDSPNTTVGSYLSSGGTITIGNNNTFKT